MKTTSSTYRTISRPARNASPIWKLCWRTRTPASLRRLCGDIARRPFLALRPQKPGTGRETIYKALKPNGDPTLDTLAKSMEALGVRLSLKD